MKKLIFTWAFLASIGTVQAADECEYASLPGKEFAFREQTESLQKYGYQQWQKKPEMASKGLDYGTYAGKKGKIQDQKVEDRVISWFVAVLETCEKVYTSGGLRDRSKSIADLEKYTGIYYTDTLSQAEALVGKSIWVNQTSTAKGHTLVTDDPSVSHPLSHLEPLEISGVSTKSIGHSRGAGPLNLVVKKVSGETGYLVFNDLYFFRANPIDQKWDKALVELIKQQKIKAGMTEQQALLSWGSPQRVNKRVGPYGVHEQWVYGGGQYVYMENGKLTSFQTSQ